MAEAARQLGLFVIVLLDDSEGLAAASDPILKDAMATSDAVIRLPSRKSIEQALVEGVADAELIRVFKEIDAAVGGLGLAPHWDAKTGLDLSGYLANLMHKRTGAIHEIFVEALDDAHLPPLGVRAIQEILNVARANASGTFVQL